MGPDKSAHRDFGNLKMFILDVLRWDELEGVQNIQDMLNEERTIGWRDQWPHDFTKGEIVPALLELVNSGMIAAYESSRDRMVALDAQELEDRANLDEVWFHLTKLGRIRWQSWHPPPDLRSANGSEW